MADQHVRKLYCKWSAGKRTADCAGKSLTTILSKNFLWMRTLGSTPALERENRELFEYRQSIEGDTADPLQPWDVAYYAEKQRAAKPAPRATGA